MEDNCQELLLCSLNNFYKNNYKYKTLLKDIINGNNKLSLRLIDWLVTHYSRINNIYYWINNNKDDEKIYPELPDEKNNKYKRVNLYFDYRAQLKSYNKLYFDTFRRHQRISFYIDDDDVVETTVGQLNFFRWAFNNNIINYAIQNYDEIYNSMIKNNSYSKKLYNKLIFYQQINKENCIIRFD